MYIMPFKYIAILWPKILFPDVRGPNLKTRKRQIVYNNKQFNNR